MTDEEIARDQWERQKSAARTSARVLQSALTAAYKASATQWAMTRQVSIPDESKERIQTALASTWARSVRLGMSFPMVSEKSAFLHIEAKQEETLFEQIIREFIEQWGAQKVQQILETTRENIVRVILKGQADGLGVEDIGKMLRDAIPSFSRLRANTIARTETHTAAMYASREVAKTAAFPLEKRWVSVFDSRTRDFGEADGVVDSANHRVMNEVTVGPNDLFEVPRRNGALVGVDLMVGPGDPSAPADQTINCRCGLTYRRAGRGSMQRAAVSISGPALPTSQLLLQNISDKQPVFAASYDKSFDRAPILALQAIDKSKDLRGMIKGKKGAYANFSNEISMGRHTMGTSEYKRVFRHEYGHILDDQMAKSNPDRPFNQKMFQSWDAVEDLAEDTRELERARSGLFVGDKGGTAALDKRILINQDERAEARIVVRKAAREAGILDDPKAILRANIMDVEPDDIIKIFGVSDISRTDAIDIVVAWQRRDVYALLQQIPSTLGHKVSHSSAIAGLQDTFEAGTGGNIRIYFGHGKQYYTKPMSSMQKLGLARTVNKRKYNAYTTAQAFANWFEAYGDPNPASRQMYKRLWPRTYASFERLVTQYVER